MKSKFKFTNQVSKTHHVVTTQNIKTKIWTLHSILSHNILTNKLPTFLISSCSFLSILLLHTNFFPFNTPLNINSFIMTRKTLKESLETRIFCIIYTLAPFVNPREKSFKCQSLHWWQAKKSTARFMNSNWKLIQKHCMNKCQ